MRLSPDDKHIVWAINEAFQHNHLTKGSELKVDNVLAWQTDEWGKSVCQKQHLVVMVIKKNGTTKKPTTYRLRPACLSFPGTHWETRKTLSIHTIDASWDWINIGSLKQAPWTAIANARERNWRKATYRLNWIYLIASLHILICDQHVNITI